MVRCILASAVVAALLCSGCGAGQSRSSLDPQPRRTLLEWDAAGATSTDPSYKQELIKTIQHIAAERGEVFAVVLDGQPITTAEIKARNFAESPPGVEAQNLPAVSQAVATGFARDFIATLTRPEAIPGSGELQGLLLASHTPRISEIYLWSDSVVDEPGGLNLYNASMAEIEAETARWKAKLTGLKNVTVVIVGGGHGIRNLQTVSRAHRLFREVIEDNGGHLVWTPTLAQR
jgi:hypothetical protein